MTNYHIDPDSPIPKYLQIYKIFLQKIEDGEWLTNQLIPPERELELIFKVSRTTVRQALSLMVNRGYFFREQGRGTFVAPLKLQQNINLVKGFSESMLERGHKPGQKILFFGYVRPSQKACGQLELSSCEKVILQIKRIRFSDDEPIGIQNTYINLQSEKRISKSDLEKKGSLYALIEEEYGIVLSEAVETLEARSANIADAKLLNIKRGHPLLRIERTVWSQYHNIIEYLEALYRGDRYKYYTRQLR